MTSDDLQKLAQDWYAFRNEHSGASPIQAEPARDLERIREALAATSSEPQAAFPLQEKLSQPPAVGVGQMFERLASAWTHNWTTELKQSLEGEPVAKFLTGIRERIDAGDISEVLHQLRDFFVARSPSSRPILLSAVGSVRSASQSGSPNDEAAEPTAEGLTRLVDWIERLN